MARVLRPVFRAPPSGGGGASRWALSGAERDAERGRELVEWAALEDVDLISEGFLPGDFLFYCQRPVLVSQTPRENGPGRGRAEFRVACTFRGAEAVLPDVLAARSTAADSKPRTGAALRVSATAGDDPEGDDAPPLRLLPFYLREVLGRRCEVSLSVSLDEWRSAGGRGALLAALHRELFCLLPVMSRLEGPVEVSVPFWGLPCAALALPGSLLVGALADCAEALAEAAPGLGRPEALALGDVCYIDYLDRDSWYYLGEHRLLSKGSSPTHSGAQVPASPSVVYAHVCDDLLFGSAAGARLAPPGGQPLWALDKMRGARILCGSCAVGAFSLQWEFDLSQTGEFCPLAIFLRSMGAPFRSADLCVTPTPVLDEGVERPGSGGGASGGRLAAGSRESGGGRAPLRAMDTNNVHYRLQAEVQQPGDQVLKRRKRTRGHQLPYAAFWAGAKNAERRKKARRHARPSRQRLMREAAEALGDSYGWLPWEQAQHLRAAGEAQPRRDRVTLPESDPLLRSFLSALPSVVTSAAHLVLLGSGPSGRGTPSNEAPSVKPKEEASGARRHGGQTRKTRRVSSPSSTDTAEAPRPAPAGEDGRRKRAVFARTGARVASEAAPAARGLGRGLGAKPLSERAAKWAQPAPKGRRSGRRNAGQGQEWRDGAKAWWKAA